MLAAILSTIIGGGQTLNPLAFSATLTHSLLPEKGGAPTFSRGSTATIEDHEGILRTCRSGEARFWGARRVENLEHSVVTNAVGAAVSTLQSGTEYLLSGLSATNADRLQKNWLDATDVSNRSFRLSFEVMAPAGQEGRGVNSRFRNGLGGAPNADGTITVTLSGTWVRYSQLITVPADALSDGAGWWLYGSGTNNATSVLYRNVQCEEVTGQTNQNPSEYVSVGILSSPYHGASVDGVKCFDTANGNTVDANGVVTEATGAALSLKGYFAEAGRTNILTNSNAVASWTLTDTTATADSIVAPNGFLEGDLLTEGILGTAVVSNSAGTLSATTYYAVSAFLKRGNTDWVRLFLDAGANSVSGWFNLATGVVGTLSAAGTGTAAKIYIEDAGSGWYRCVIVGQFSGAITANVALHSASADAATTRVNSATYYAWGGQAEAGGFASTLISTTTASATRGLDVLNYSNPTSNFNAVGSAYAEISPNHAYTNIANASWRGRVVGGGAGQQTALNINPVTASANMWDGTTSFDVGTNTLQWARAFMYKAASSWSGTTMNVSEGGQSNSGAFDGSIFNGDTAFRVGTTGGENATLYGGVKNLKLYRKAYTAAELNAMTTV